MNPGGRADGGGGRGDGSGGGGDDEDDGIKTRLRICEDVSFYFTFIIF